MRKFILGVILIISILVLLLAHFIQPVVKFDDSKTDKQSLNEIIGKQTLGSIKNIMVEGRKDFQIKLSEEEVNDILYWKLQEFKSGKIDGIHCKTFEDSLIMYVDSASILPIPTQFILKTKPSLRNGKAEFQVEEVHIGKVKVPRALFFSLINNKIEYLEVNAKDYQIDVPFKLPEQITLSELKVSDGLKFKLAISIKSREDLINVFKFLYPKDFENKIKGLFW